jgi:hypothetical protein
MEEESCAFNEISGRLNMLQTKPSNFVSLTDDDDATSRELSECRR